MKCMYAACILVFARAGADPKEYLRSILYSFKEICSFKETIFIQQRHVPGHSRTIYSTSFPSHFIVIINFIIAIS